MPRLQHIVDKYERKGLVVLAVNIVASQNDLVGPLLEDGRYTFTALKGTPEVKKAYGVTGAPTEFLIDPKGYIAAKVRLNSDEREARVGKMIEELMEK